MVFKNNIPQPNDTLDVSQGDLLGNNQQLDTSFGINHYSFSDLTVNNGKHKFVNLPNFTPSGSVPTNVAGEGVVYTDSIGGLTQLFFNRDTEGAGRRVQLTSGTLSGGNNVLFATNTLYAANNNGGWSFLPGGLILQYGLNSTAAGGNILVPFPIAFPTAVFMVLATMVRNSTNVDAVYVNSITLNDFRCRDTTSGNNFYWMAIGN